MDMDMEKRIYLLSQSIEKRFVLSIDEEIILFDVKSKEGTTKYFINKQPYDPKNSFHEMIINNWPFGFDRYL
jgi:hypothetical protein